MIVQIVVKPGAKKEEVIKQPDGTYKVCVKARAIEGQANDAVREAIAAHFKVSKSRVALRRGMKSKIKQLEVN